MDSALNKIPFYQVDAFALKPFSGNPAAVFLCEEPLLDELYQSIASEMYLPETTFMRVLDDKTWKESQEFEVRWFMQDRETNLCGHATLAAAHTIFEEINSVHTEVRFKTKSTDLWMKKLSDGRIEMKFPVATDFEDLLPPVHLLEKMGIKETNLIERSVYIASKQTWIVELEDKKALMALRPDFDSLKKAHFDLPIKKVGFTVASDSKPYDFVSRFFCPWIGINEDMLSAVSHGLFAQFWKEKMSKKIFFAHQASPRGGEIELELIENNQILLRGKGITTLEGFGRV